MKPASFVGLIILAACLAGCAKSADEIGASYVSPLAYQDYSCDQLSAEQSRISARAAEVAGVQDEAASDDAAVMAIGLILFWPSLFFLEGDTGREAELGRLRGEMDAIETVAVRKECFALLDEFERRRQLIETERKKREEEAKARNTCPIGPGHC